MSGSEGGAGPLVTGPLVIGVGNRWRRDDGIGPWVTDRMADSGIETIEHSGEGAGLIDAWSGRDRVILVDAAQAGAAVGTIHCFDAVTTELPRRFFRYSSHLFGVAEAVETARALGRLPQALIVYGIEGADFGFGDALTPEVERAGIQVADAIKAAGTHLDPATPPTTSR